MEKKLTEATIGTEVVDHGHLRYSEPAMWRIILELARDLGLTGIAGIGRGLHF